VPDRLEEATRAVEIVTCRFESRGEPTPQIAQGEPLEVVWDIRFHEDVDNPIFALSLRNDVGHTVFSTSSTWQNQHTGHFSAGELVRLRVAFEAWLAPSRYRATPSVARAGSGASMLDLREDLASVILHATRVTGGMIDPPHSFEVEHIRRPGE
jgi:hypothetical protein